MFKVFIVGVSFTVIVAPCSAIQFVARALIGTPRLAGLMMRAVLLTVALAEPFLSEESHQQAFEKFVKDFEKAYSAWLDFRSRAAGSWSGDRYSRAAENVGYSH